MIAGFFAERGPRERRTNSFPANLLGPRVPPSAWYQALVSFYFINFPNAGKVQKVPGKEKKGGEFLLPRERPDEILGGIFIRQSILVLNDSGAC